MVATDKPAPMKPIMKFRFAAFLLLCTSCLWPAFGEDRGTNETAAVDGPSGQLRAGAAVADITPEQLPVSMTGSFQDRQATGVADRLHARSLVLDDGRIRVAVVVCDSCLISREIFDAAKQIASQRTGIPTERMLMSATHTHTAPTAVPLAQCNPDPQYVQWLTQQIAAAVIKANARLQPAQIGWGSGEEPNEVGNRRWFVQPEAILTNPFGRTDDKVRMNPPAGSDQLIRPAGPVDPEVSVVSVQTTTGEPLAVLGNYSLHYVGGIPAGQLSADYFGEFARQIAARVEGDESFVGIMSNGTSGDVNNYNFREKPRAAAPLVRVREVADRIADVAAQASAGIEYRGGIALAMHERKLELGVRRPNETEVARAQELLAAAADPQRLNTPELYAQETLRLANHAPTVEIKLQVLRIGELAIAAIPCEVFAEMGLEIKRRSPFPDTFTISLANGYSGYLPTPEQHALGGYETWRSGWSFLEEQASRKITEALIEMLAKAKAERRELSSAKPVDTERPIDRILFGSCIQQDRPIPIFQTMLAEEPQLTVLLGDNIYADTSDMSVMQAKYDALAANPDFAALRAASPILATWDDHDYGPNDGGADFAKRAEAQQVFLDFWGDAADSPRRQRPGIYDAHVFGPPGKRVQVILLDTRYFRSPLTKGERRLGGPYFPDTDPKKTMLGEAQWRWLEQQLRTPAEVRIIASSIQCVAEAAGQETWSNFPAESARLFRLIRKTGAGGVVIISGDRHWAELSVAPDEASYPVYDLTSSSFNQVHPRGTPTKNLFRAIDKTYHRENFGVIAIDWDQADPELTLEIRGLDNEVKLEHRVRLSELQPRR